MTDQIKSLRTHTQAGSFTDINSMQPEAEEIVAQYVKLTGREARVSIYEHSLFDFIRAKFTCEEFVLVVKFLVAENRRNKFQYSLKFGSLINDHQRFMDLLGEARAKERNRVKSLTPKEKVLNQFRPAMGESLTATGAMSVGDILRKVVKDT